ncbi:hypothetical protein K8R33_01850 [archaeon]|nr:hypothetical protein [archaeon]
MKWTNEETNILKGNYVKKTFKELGLILNRSYKSIQEKSYRLKLNKIYPKSRSESLKKYYQINQHHTKGKKKSKEHKEKLSIARKNYRKDKIFPKSLNLISPSRSS